MALALLVAGAAEAQEVGPEDLAAAEAAEQRAAADLAAAREELATAAELQRRLTATLESLTDRRAEVDAAAVREASAVRDRLARMYMAAGRAHDLLAAVGDVAGFFVRLAYFGAVADRDLEEVNRFVLVVDDLESLRDQADRQLADLAAEVVALELVAVSRSAALEDASARLATLRAEWAEQEAARRAALEAETRRQEAELAAATTSTTTSTVVGSGTTTTTVAGGFSTDDGGFSYDPSGGVE